MKKYLLKISAIFTVMTVLAGFVTACGTTDGQEDPTTEQVEQQTESAE